MSEGLQKDSYCLEGVLISIILKALLFFNPNFLLGGRGGGKTCETLFTLSLQLSKMTERKRKGAESAVHLSQEGKCDL